MKSDAQRNVRYANLICFAMVAVLNGCASSHSIKMQRSDLISFLESEMVKNTEWVRIHAAEGLLAGGSSSKVREMFLPEVDTATAPYRIGVWRVLARATTGAERDRYIARLRSVLHDPKASDRISAAESLAKLNAAAHFDREVILNWLTTANPATAAFPRWLLVLASSGGEREQEEAALAKLLSAGDAVARLRAAFALGRLKTISASSLNSLREQLKIEPADSIARIYLITALLLHSDNPYEILHLEASLANYVNGKPNEQLELGIVTGLRGKQEGVALLTPLLNSPVADARIGAATGLLRLVP